MVKVEVTKETRRSQKGTLMQRCYVWLGDKYPEPAMRICRDDSPLPEGNYVAKNHTRRSDFEISLDLNTLEKA